MSLQSTFEKILYIVEFGWVPRAVKWVVVIVFLIHFKSWPFAWHYRFFKPIVRVVLRRKLAFAIAGWRNADKALTSVAPVGTRVFELTAKYKTSASLDDCDYNGHLNNGAYAKSTDYARAYAVEAAWYPFFYDGGWMALAGAYYTWVKEIPAGTDYEVWISFGGWEDKWFYPVAHFISFPKGKGKKSKTSNGHAHPSADRTEPSLSQKVFAEMHHKREHLAPGSLTNFIAANSEVDGTPLHSGAGTPMPMPEYAKKYFPEFATLPPKPADPSCYGTFTPYPTTKSSSVPANFHRSISLASLPPGAVVHAIAVSQYCFKHGRVTVPPEVAFSAMGLGGLRDGVDPYELGSEEPLPLPTGASDDKDPEALVRWKRYQILRGLVPDDLGILVDGPKAKSGPQRMKEFYRGGWKQEGDWWRLGKDVENVRAQRMESLGKFRQAMMGWGSERI